MFGLQKYLLVGDMNKDSLRLPKTQTHIPYLFIEYFSFI